MYGCESWTIKKAEHQRIDAFELWCWRRLLRVPWTARRSNLIEISTEYSLEGLMLKLKLQYFGHLMLRAYSFEKTLRLGKIEGRRRRGWQRIRWLDGITNSMDMGLSKFQQFVMNRESWHAAVHGVTKIWTWLSDCKEIQPVHPKGDQSCVFIGKPDAEAETLILWPPHAKSWLIGKDPDAGRDWGQEEKRTTENDTVGWHHRLNGHEFE